MSSTYQIDARRTTTQYTMIDIRPSPVAMASPTHCGSFPSHCGGLSSLYLFWLMIFPDLLFSIDLPEI